MPRPSQLPYPPNPPVPARPAATLLLLRDGPHGPEVLLTRRSAQARFVPNAYVFPGGSLDAEDAHSHHLSHRRSSQSDEQLTHAIAAIRETFEEMGILLARHANGAWVSAAEVAQLDRRASLGSQCAAWGLTLAAHEVHDLARWITDRNLPIRFDVPFLVARMPEGQEPVADDLEQFEPLWITAAAALQRHQAGHLHMIHPTIYTLQWLQQHATVSDILKVCSASEAPLWTSCPRGAWSGGHKVHVMEHETAFGELLLTCPDGQVQHHIDWQHEHPVILLKNVQRLTAPNPGFMTGPGTNSYVIGDPSTGHIVIDPGPDEPTHLERLWRAAGGDIRAIVCTHSHPDHAPGASGLQALVLNGGQGRPPILGLPHGPHAKPHSHFQPDVCLEDGERLLLQNHDGSLTHTLRVLHTPGHTANHLCLWLEEDGLLFSGDHILNGSTTLVASPDGNMQAYLDSLDRLLSVCVEPDMAFILPAHGHVLHPAAEAIVRLKAHRLAREAKVLQAMQALPAGNLDDWLPLVYADVPERIWPIAKLSLQAHVERLESLGTRHV